MILIIFIGLYQDFYFSVRRMKIFVKGAEKFCQLSVPLMDIKADSRDYFLVSFSPKKFNIIPKNVLARK